MKLLALILLPTLAFSQTVTNYSTDTTRWPNPERGFYTMSSRYSGGLNGDTYPWNATNLANIRNGTEPYIAGAKGSLVRREYILNNYYSSAVDTTSAMVVAMQSDMDSLRKYGMKCVFQICYGGGGSLGSSYPTSISKIMTDMDLLKSFLIRNADVICVYQMGWIGLDGECASDNGQNQSWLFTYTASGYLHADTSSQRQLIQHYLSVTPKSRFIQIRAPRVTNWIWGTHWTNGGGDRLNASLADTLPLANAFDGSDRARLGGYDDALGTDPWDKGTFDGLPYSGCTASDTTGLYPWMRADSRLVFSGGETDEPSKLCGDPYGPYYTDSLNWAFSGTHVMEYLRNFHTSFNNPYYYHNTTDYWRSTGTPSWFCEFDRYMGYRFNMVQSTIPTTATQGGSFRVQFTIRNDGVAAPMNPRGLEIVLVGTTDTVHFDIAHYRQQPYDPRYWWGGSTISIDTTLTISPTQATGNYTVCLNLPDTCRTVAAGAHGLPLYGRPEYSIRVAGSPDPWNATTGFNSLQSTVTISSGSPTVTKFAVTMTGGTTALSAVSKTAGTAFQVRVTAQDAGSSTVTGYTGTVALTSNAFTGTVNANITTGGYVDGISITPTVYGSGDRYITANDGTVNTTNASGNFSVDPGAASLTTSTVSAYPTSIVGNGVSTSAITVQLKDDYGNLLTGSGGTVVVSTDLGSVGSTTDNTNGTYSAVLTSAASLGTATVSATLSSNPITHTASVTFVGPARKVVFRKQ